MEFTKALKEYVEEQMNEARYEANKEAKANYEARIAKAEEEIEIYILEVVEPHIEEILKANNMDLIINNRPAPDLILQYDSDYIFNEEEYQALYRAERERQKKQDEAIKKFAIEYELGIDKDEFYEKVAELTKEVK